MNGCWIALMAFAGSVALLGGTGCAAASPGGGSGEVEAASLPENSNEKSAEPDVPQPQWEGQADRERFRKALSLIGQCKFQNALELLKLNIQETPNAGNIDYSYGWGCLCLAKLGRFDEALTYYEIICTRYYGWIRKGARGAVRQWEKKLDEVKVSVKASSRPDKDAILKRMTELDKHALNSYLTDAEKLIRSASMGDKTAIERLKGEDYRRYEEALIKLIELGRLELKEEK